MVVAFVALALGVVLATEFSVPLWISATASLILLVGTFVLRSQLMLFTLIVAVGMALKSSEPSQADTLPRSSREALVYTIEIERGHWATLKRWYGFDSEWRESGARLFVMSGDSVELRRGDTYVVGGDFTLLSSTSSQFEESIKRQGAEGYLKFWEGEILEVIPSSERLNDRMHRWAIERIQRLNLSPRAEALSEAITLGYRTDIDRELSQLYINSGVQHLLAISGLHVGVVILMATWLFAPLALLRHGQIWRGVVVILLLWMFVLCTTMPVSVVRAAAMFTLLYISIQSGERYSSFNGLAAIAFVMTLFEPGTLFDVGFQLSFISVGAIILFYPRVYQFIKWLTPLLLVRYFLGLIAIGVIATVAVIPVLSNSFGYLSPLSPLSTLPMLPLIYVMISTSLLWIVLPLPLLQPLVEWLIEWSVWAQILIVEWVSALPFSRVNFRMEAWGVALFYLLLIAISFVISRKNEKK